MECKKADNCKPLIGNYGTNINRLLKKMSIDYKRTLYYRNLTLEVADFHNLM